MNFSVEELIRLWKEREEACYYYEDNFDKSSPEMRRRWRQSYINKKEDEAELYYKNNLSLEDRLALESFFAYLGGRY